MEDTSTHAAGLSDAAEWFVALLALLLLAWHFLNRRSRNSGLPPRGSSDGHFSGKFPAAVRFSTIVTCVLVYATSIFVLASELLTTLRRAATRTRGRGEKWVKELDYVYFAFGSLGAVLAVNRMNAIGEKLILSDLFVPVILASALVIRVIKTRAEINEWHKPKRGTNT